MLNFASILTLCSECDVGEFGDTNAFRPMTVGLCTNAYFGTYSLVTSIGNNIYGLQFNCTDATCSVCNPPIFANLGVCVSYASLGTNFSFVITNSRCQAALTPPSIVPSNSVSVLWRNNTLSCINASYADVLTFGAVNTSLLCIPYENGYYAGLQLNANGTYSGGLWCSAGCTNCAQTISSLALNTCAANGTSGASVNVQLTSTISTCYVTPPVVFLSVLNDGFVILVFYL